MDLLNALTYFKIFSDGSKRTL